MKAFRAFVRSLAWCRQYAPMIAIAERSPEDFSMGSYALLMAKVQRAAIQSALYTRRDRVCSGRERMAC